MRRGTKQVLYGALYLILFALVLWGVYRAFLPGAPTCADGIRNRGEQGIDCGGPCAPCALARFEPLRAGPAAVFGTSAGRAVLLAEVVNPNATAGAFPFTFTFSVFSSDDRLLETVGGSEVIYAAERRRLWTGEIRTAYPRIARATLEVSSPRWRAVGETLRPDLKERGVQTVREGNRLSVRGTVANQSSLPVPRVKVIAVLYDSFGGTLFASQTILDDVSALGERDFTVPFPEDEPLVERVDPARTKVFLSSQ